jgi:hypothetical protein
MSPNGYASRRIISMSGPISMDTRRWRCRACGLSQDEHPHPEGVSSLLQEKLSYMATCMPFEKAQKAWDFITEQELPVALFKQSVQRRGQALLETQDLEAQQAFAWDEDAKPKPDALVVEPEASLVPELIYLELDGVFSKQRQRDQTREQTPLPGGRGGLGRCFHVTGVEVKNALIYREDDCAQLSPKRGALLQRHAVSHVGNCHDFKRLLYVELQRQRVYQASKIVVLSDGAPWIVKVIEELQLENVTLILDLFHVKDKVRDAAASLFSKKTEQRRAWQDSLMAKLEDGQIQEVIQELEESERSTKEVESLLHYIRTNESRMNYPYYRAQGWRVGSGAVESLNRHMTAARLRGAGMRWEEEGAKRMARLRADLHNDRWKMRTVQLGLIA